MKKDDKDILSNIGEGRRDFFRKLLTGDASLASFVAASSMLVSPDAQAQGDKQGAGKGRGRGSGSGSGSGFVKRPSG